MNNFVMVSKEIINSNIGGKALKVYLKMIDRYNLSIKNNWKDKEGKCFIIMKREEICESFKLSKRTASSILNELEEAELIMRKQQGLGRPSYIYINTTLTHNIANNMCDVKGSESNCYEFNEKMDSCSAEQDIEDVAFGFYESFFDNLSDVISEEMNKTLEQSRVIESEEIPNKKCKKLHLKKCNFLHSINNININNNILLSNRIDEIENTLKNKIGYESLVLENKELANIVLEVAIKTFSAGKDVFINGRLQKYELVCDKFNALEQKHIDYIAECMNKLPAPPRNIFNYIRTCMFNAPDTINIYYKQWDKCAQKQRFSANFTTFEQRKLDQELDEMEQLLLMSVNGFC